MYLVDEIPFRMRTHLVHIESVVICNTRVWSSIWIVAAILFYITFSPWGASWVFITGIVEAVEFKFSEIALRAWRRSSTGTRACRAAIVITHTSSRAIRRWTRARCSGEFLLLGQLIMVSFSSHHQLTLGLGWVFLSDGKYSSILGCFGSSPLFSAKE